MSISALLYLFCIIILLANLWYFIKYKKTIRIPLLGMVGGFCTLVMLHFVLLQLGISFAINYFTSLVSISMGIPGVLAILVYHIW